MRRGFFGVAVLIASLYGCNETEVGSMVGLTDEELCHQHDGLEYHCHKLEHQVNPPDLPDIFATPDTGTIEKEIDCDETPGAFGCPCTDNNICKTCR